MDKKIDLRIIKTNMVLYDALVNLLKDHPFEEIKVSDICAKALVNRSTFYAHFNDKYELFMSFINDLKESFIQELKTIDQDLSLKDYYLKLIEVFLNHVEGKEDIYKSILTNNRNSIIMDMIYNTIQEDVNSRIRNNDKDVPDDIFTSYYMGSIVNVGIDWLKGNKKYTKEEMLKYLNNLMN
jgi:AcrR family transcriptional regulator